MILIENIKTGWHQLLLNKGKSLLTMLGIIVGIASVIYMMTIGQTVKNFLISQIESMGTNTLMVMPNYGSSDTLKNNFTLTTDDVEAVRSSQLTKSLSGISGVLQYPTKFTYDASKKTFDTTITAIHPDGQIVGNLEVKQGRFFNLEEYQRNAKVALIFENDINTVFGNKNPIGETISIENKNFTIIGVMKKQSSLQPSMGKIQLVAPLTTVQYLFNDGAKDIYYINAKVDKKENILAMQAAIANILNNRHPVGKDEDKLVSVESMDSYLAIFNNVLLGIQLFLSLIAAISLIVGGIGIMNIMLMTVKERTKEIGLRKAIGAKKQHILMQFLVEASVLTIIGGIIGIIIGISFSAITVFIVGLVKPDWNFTLSISWLGVILSCAVSLFTGIIFGLYPAMKASRLSPIEALRYE